MIAAAETVEGTLQPDGLTLHLERRLSLPPGPVLITVKHANPRTGPTMLETLDRIHAEQQNRGRTPMTDDEMAAEIAQTRAEGDDEESRWLEIWAGTRKPNTDKP